MSPQWPPYHSDSGPRPFPDAGQLGVPTVYSIEANTILFGPVPDIVYPISIVYYAKFASLITAQTNWLMTYHPSIYLFAVLAEAMYFTQDMDLMKLYKERYQAEVSQLQRVDDRSLHSGSVLRVRTI